MTGRNHAGSPNLALAPGPEFDLVRAFLARWGESARGVGGDCASLDLPDGERLVVSIDTSVEGVHFLRPWLTPREIGYRAAAAAWSDIAAVAARPLGALLAVTASADWTADLPDVAEGIGDAARAVGAPVVGGDTTAGPALVITLTVLGSAAHPLTRAGARVGDRVYLTGTLGGPAAAVGAWRAGASPDEAARARFAHPTPRVREAQWLAARGATGAIDLSDGLLADVGQLAAASGVRVVVDLDRVPRWRGLSALDAAASGEEYELVVTAPVAIDGVAFARELALPLTYIGDVVEGETGVDARLGGRRVDPAPGYQHFSDRR